jgi:transglutaminase-like putative cysteine protease
MEEYLKASEVIDWQHATIVELAKKIAFRYQTSEAIALACFEWVRDEIYHSYDYQIDISTVIRRDVAVLRLYKGFGQRIINFWRCLMNPLTCRASDVLKYKTGYCFAKSHLLAALLRANNIPAGFCYQRLSINDNGEPYTLHGFNAVYLPEIGWYRVDARGNRNNVDAQFVPPKEQLAYKIQFPQEADFENIFSEPLSLVVEALLAYSQWNDILLNLPDVSLESLEKYNLVLRTDLK